MKKSKTLAILILPLLVLSSCDSKSNTSTSSAGVVSNNSASNNSGTTSNSTTEEKEPIEVISTVNEVEVKGTITIRVRVNKNIADRTVDFTYKNGLADRKIFKIKNAKSNKLEGVVSCVIEGVKFGEGTLLISMHDKTQTETKELPIKVVTMLNTPKDVWRVVANNSSYTFTSKPADESKVTASNTTVTRVTDKSIVVTDGSNSPIKVTGSDINTTYRVNDNLSYSNTLNIGGFPMDKDGNASLDGAIDEDKGFSNKSVLTNYFNGDLVDIYGITTDKNGNVMYIAKNKKTGEFYNNLQAFTNDNGYVTSDTMSGLAEESYNPFNYLTYYGNNSVRTSGDVHGSSGYYGLNAINYSWLTFDKDYSNVYTLTSSAPTEIDSSSSEDDKTDYMEGMKYGFAKILIWNMMSPKTFVPTLLNYIGSVGETSFKWSEFAELVNVSITVLSNSDLSISLSAGNDLNNYYSAGLPEMIGTISDVNSTDLSGLTEVNTFTNRTDLEATTITYNETFSKMVNYINEADEYKLAYYDGSTIEIDIYGKSGSYLVYDYSATYLDLIREEYPKETISKVGWFADADKKAWQVTLNDDYTVNTISKVELTDGSQADYSTFETSNKSNIYTLSEKAFKLDKEGNWNSYLNTFSQTMYAPFSGYDKGFVSYSPIAQEGIFSDFWSNVSPDANKYGTWMTILSPTTDDEGNVTKVSMTRAMSQADSSSYSIYYPNAFSCTGEGESLEAMDDGFKTIAKDIMSKHSSEITEKDK